MDGEAHDVVETAVDTLDSGCADPFLNTVGSGFVKRLVTVYIVDDFVGREGCKFDFGDCAESGGRCRGADGHAGDHLLRTTLELRQHSAGIGRVGGFAEDFAVDDDHGVGGDDESVFRVGSIERIGIGFETREVGSNFVGSESVGDCLVDGVGGVDSKFDVEHREEFATAWRAAGKDYVVAVEVLKWMKHGGIESERVGGLEW